MSYLTDEDAKDICLEYIKKNYPILWNIRPFATEFDIGLIQYVWEKCKEDKEK